MKQLLSLLIFIIICSSLLANKVSHRTVYDGKRGMNLWHITKVLQDQTGFIWISSWEGLTRFDGYNFVTFKSKAGDGSPLTSNRVRDIELSKNDGIYCLVDDRWFLFSQKEGAFYSITDSENNALTTQKKLKAAIDSKKKKKSKRNIRKITDRQGVRWELAGDSIIKTITINSPASSWYLPNPTQVRCLYKESSLNYWVTTKDDKYVILYDKNNNLLGYLTPSGNISKNNTSFCSPIYCMLQVSTDVCLLGSKPDGIYQLERKGEKFDIKNISLGNEDANSIYDIKKDNNGRIWIATFDGIFCISGKLVEQVKQTKGWRVRNLHLTDNGILLAATTGGLAIGKIPSKLVSNMHLNMHRREANRKNSLSNNATMDILELPDLQFFVSTESGGVNKIISQDLLIKEIEFAHYDKENGLATEAIVALAQYNKDWIWVIGGNCLMMLNVKTGETKSYDESFFGIKHQYSDTHPILLPDNRWLFGLHNGAFTIQGNEIVSPTSNTQLVFTSIRLENDDVCYSVSHLKELKMNSNQRNLQVSFSSLDFIDTENVRFAYRLHDTDEWCYIGNQHVITLSDMKPGDYQLQVMCTGDMGTWLLGVKTLNIHVTPKFTETIWSKMLAIFIIIAFSFIVVYTYLYIRNVKRKQKETLSAYLALLENKNGENDNIELKNTLPLEINEDDDIMMKRILTFIESHLSDSNIGIVEMAEAASVSRSSLNRKMKTMVGLTPADFLRETRMRHAQRYLLGSNKGISEIAYTCGFTDPKYFSKTFKAITGMSPTEFRLNGKNRDK